MTTKAFVALLVVLGAIWIFLVWGTTAWFGLSAGDIEREHNPASVEASSLQEQAP